MQTINSIETYPNGMSRGIIRESEEIKHNNIIRKYDQFWWCNKWKLNRRQHKLTSYFSPFVHIINCWWLWIRKNKRATRPNKLSIETDKIYLYCLDLYEPKYQFLITKRQEVKKHYYDGPCPFIKYQNNIDNIYTNINN